MRAKALHKDIVVLHHAGRTVNEIVTELNVPRTTVYNVLKRQKDLGSIEQKPGAGRPVTQLTETFLNEIKAKAKRSPNKSIKKMARELKMSDGTMRTGLKKLGVKSRARVKRFLLTKKSRPPGWKIKEDSGNFEEEKANFALHR